MQELSHGLPCRASGIRHWLPGPGQWRDRAAPSVSWARRIFSRLLVWSCRTAEGDKLPDIHQKPNTPPGRGAWRIKVPFAITQYLLGLRDACWKCVTFLYSSPAIFFGCFYNEPDPNQAQITSVLGMATAMASLHLHQRHKQVVHHQSRVILAWAILLKLVTFRLLLAHREPPWSFCSFINWWLSRTCKTHATWSCKFLLRTAGATCRWSYFEDGSPCFTCLVAKAISHPEAKSLAYFEVIRWNDWTILEAMWHRLFGELCRPQVVQNCLKIQVFLRTAHQRSTAEDSVQYLRGCILATCSQRAGPQNLLGKDRTAAQCQSQEAISRKDKSQLWQQDSKRSALRCCDRSHEHLSGHLSPQPWPLFRVLIAKPGTVKAALWVLTLHFAKAHGCLWSGGVLSPKDIGSHRVTRR